MKKRNQSAFTQEGSALWWAKNTVLALCPIVIFVIASIAVNAL